MPAVIDDDGGRHGVGNTNTKPERPIGVWGGGGMGLV